MIHFGLMDRNALALAVWVSQALMLFVGSACGTANEVEPVVQIGQGAGENFMPYEDNSDCRVFFASQGGYFVMAIVNTNLPEGSEFFCGLEAEGELISEQLVRIAQFSSGARTASLALSVYPGEPDKVAALDGRPGLLYCDAAGETFETAVQLKVELEEDALSRQQAIEPASLVNGN